jgi:D-apionolactonase
MLNDCGILVLKTAVMQKNIIWHGGHDNNCRRHLRAGRLSMIYENGSIRHVRTGHEIIRMVYMAVRDRNWLTIPPVISDEQVIVRTDSFIIKFRFHFLSGDISFSARMIIEGGSDSTLSLRFRGDSHSSFEKNRIGFCVLHPLNDVAGNDCMTENPDGGLTIGKFPLLVSPHQPFTDITLMQWNIRGISCRLDFYGDIFETEDQRNWTDASFKTYAPPLKVPFPVRVETGETQYQKIILKIQSADNSEIPVVPKSRSIKVFSDKMLPVPMIGIGRSTRPVPLTEHEASIISDARFTHYRADIYLFRGNWETEVSLAASEALLLKCSLELALFFDDDYSAQAGRFMTWAVSNNCPIAVVLLFHRDHNHSPETLLKQLLPILKNALPRTQIGAGTNANFAQVNRNRPESADPDLICWSVHPQEHATDNLTITENLGGQPSTIETARSFSSAAAWVSPVNLVRRFNPNIENFESPPENAGFPPQADSRIMSLFGACWAAGSIKQLSESGAAGITYFETVGERGIIQGDFPSRWPVEFPAEKGMIFPMFHVFRFIPDPKSYNVLKCISDDPLSTDALVLSDGDNARFILVNYTDTDLVTAVEGLKGKFTFRQLNEDTFADAARDPFWLDKAPQKKITGKKLRLPKYSVSFGEGRMSVEKFIVHSS